MALKATIHKAQVQIADVDRHVYVNHALTLARHPSETDERLMVRLLAFALHVPADAHDGRLEFAKGLSDTDEPDLWHKDLSGQILHWIEVGQPDERRLLKASARAARVSILAYSATVPTWWRPIESGLARARNLSVWAIAPEQSRALAALAQRTMTLQINVQDGTAWIGDASRSVEVSPLALKLATA
jgi:uncharacterized protein YaeQ